MGIGPVRDGWDGVARDAASCGYGFCQDRFDGEPVGPFFGKFAIPGVELFTKDVGDMLNSFVGTDVYTSIFFLASRYRELTSEYSCSLRKWHLGGKL